MSRAVTIDDVAKLAGVSRATAARVMGGYGSASKKSRASVEEAARILNYIPNMAAKGLRGKGMKTLAIILPSIRNNYCNRLIHAVESEASAFGYDVIICNTHENVETELRHMRSMSSRQVEGVIVMSSARNVSQIDTQYLDLYRGDMPMVFVDRTIVGLDSDVICSDNVDASSEAIRKLLDLGHRSIGVMTVNRSVSVMERIDGYRRMCEQHGIRYDEDLIRFIQPPVDDDSAQGLARLSREATAELLDRGCTALYVMYNDLCAGVIQELDERGLSLGDDISLVSWDDDMLNVLMGITTVDQQVELMGKEAVRRLLAGDGKQSNHAEHEATVSVFPAQLIDRRSCGRCKTA
ncbi:LacI family DNA-binding transcriptional regulator [Bifidobacterium sp. 82T24]|uniref:LacI family DNA-binding transcriptional regulator n=1 Tax=Bifidobacterium pluvialisilvae TaxID=2834436 RepID=UPI001C58DC3E|nr:LacI family DNA-binding transcriptional regulator [Bifidobacterium pluvialisilvae]MBW3088699.1 LacI family DNA-binding transcriptional regulator [Bifidobacterium pluvialisilvae]